MGDRTAATVTALAALGAAVTAVAPGVVPCRAVAGGVLQASAWRAGLELSAGVHQNMSDTGESS